MKRLSQMNPRMSRQRSVRFGVTLSEVLVSMLIMSIGVVSLATLFPISVLRTAQATQLTHAVFLRNNAEAVIESNPNLLSNAQIFGANGLGVIDPLGVQLIGTPTIASTGGRAGVGVGSMLGGVGRTDGMVMAGATAAARLLAAEQLASLPDSWTSVIEDSVTGTSLVSTPPTITISKSLAGTSIRSSTTPANALHRMVMTDASGRLGVVQPLYRITGGDTLSWWDSSWTAGPRLPTGFTPTRVRVEVQERRYTWLLTARKRWNPTGAAAGLDGAWGVSGVDDDGDGTADNTTERAYPGSDDDKNWTVELELAVFYNRSYRAAAASAAASTAGDETAHVLTFPVNNGVAGTLTSGAWNGFDSAYGVKGVDDDQNGTVDDASESRFPGSDDNRTVLVSYTTSSRPYFKKGSYMLEPSQLRWYRIVDFKDGAATNTTVLLLDQDLRHAPTTAGTVPGISGIFLKGIIEVYSLGSRSGVQ